MIIISNSCLDLGKNWKTSLTSATTNNADARRLVCGEGTTTEGWASGCDHTRPFGKFIALCLGSWVIGS